MTETETETKTNEELQDEYQRQEDEKKQLIDDHIKLSKELLNTPFDELPKRKLNDKEQQDLEENFDVSKKLTFISNRIKYKDGTDILFRFDSALLDKNKEDIQFCHAIKGAIAWAEPELVKKYMLEYIKRDFNDNIKEVHIRSKGNVYEKDICIIMNPKTDDQILWIKFLKEEITDDMWKQLKESNAGTDSVVINNTIGRSDPDS